MDEQSDCETTYTWPEEIRVELDDVDDQESKKSYVAPSQEEFQAQVERFVSNRNQTSLAEKWFLFFLTLLYTNPETERTDWKTVVPIFNTTRFPLFQMDEKQLRNHGTHSVKPLFKSIFGKNHIPPEIRQIWNMDNPSRYAPKKQNSRKKSVEVKTPVKKRRLATYDHSDPGHNDAEQLEEDSEQWDEDQESKQSYVAPSEEDFKDQVERFVSNKDQTNMSEKLFLFFLLLRYTNPDTEKVEWKAVVPMFNTSRFTFFKMDEKQLKNLGTNNVKPLFKSIFGKHHIPPEIQKIWNMDKRSRSVRRRKPTSGDPSLVKAVETLYAKPKNKTFPK